MEHERLEVMERQVTASEASPASCEVRVQAEIDERVAGVRRAFS